VFCYSTGQCAAAIFLSYQVTIGALEKDGSGEFAK
jgi:hypothetical protein